MGDNAKTLSPVGVVKEALSLWRANFLIVSLLYCLVILLAKLLKISASLTDMLPVGNLVVFKAVITAARFIVALSLNSWVSLLIMEYFREKKPRLGQALDLSFKSLKAYLLSLFLLLAIFLGGVGAGYAVLLAGNAYFVSSAAAESVRIGVLLAASTVTVVFFISAAWYGVFFSLAPLIGAFENKGALAAIQASRSRIRGNALGYIAIFLGLMALYVLIGLGAYRWLWNMPGARQYVLLVDPALAVLLGPLWLAFWYRSYENLSPAGGSEERA